MNAIDLKGRSAIVTGAAQGIGRSIAGRLLASGAVVSLWDRDAELLAGTGQELAGAGEVGAVAVDVTDAEAVAGAFASTVERHEAVDIMVCNAGINPFYGSMSDIPDWAFDKIMSSNVRSNHWLCQMIAPDMAAKGAGSIVITSSTGAFHPSATLGTYNISKIADLGLVRNLALELGPKGIRVNAICPGTIKTDFARVLWETDEAARGVIEGTPLRRIGEPDDLKGVAVFLASDASRHMTGQALTVCGGMFMWR